MSTIIFLSGRSANDALGAAGRAHRRLYESLGFDFVEMNSVEPGFQDRLGRTVTESTIEFVWAPMGLGADFKGMMSDGREVNFWEGMRIPYLSLMGDSPAYGYSRHVMPTSWHAALYFYPEHLEFRKRLPLTAALYGLVPIVPFDEIDRRSVDFRKKERSTLLFLKNGNDPERLMRSWREVMPAPTFLLLAELAGDLASALDSESGCDIDAVVTARFGEKGWDISECLNLRLFFVAQLDDYLRRVKSTFVAETIADFPVEIQGSNWEHVDLSGRRAKLIPGVDYLATRERILDSLAVVDMSPNTQGTPHDRVLRALGLYTLCLTNEQRFLEEHFPDWKLFTYRYDRQALRAKIDEVLTHPKRYVELGAEIGDRFVADHRPEEFARFMVDTASHIRLACGRRPDGLQDYFLWPP